MNIIKKIYLHWSATDHSWCEPGDYHTVITGEGQVHRLTDYHTPLYAATYCRNTDSISLAVAAMSPEGGTWAHAPTEAQIDALCKEVAHICIGLGWKGGILEYKVMTHAEAGGLRDYPRDLVAQFSNVSPSQNWDTAAQDAGLPHANYGPSAWHDGWPGGDVDRWDLWKLRESDVGGMGGHELRVRIGEWIGKIEAHK